MREYTMPTELVQLQARADELNQELSALDGGDMGKVDALNEQLYPILDQIRKLEGKPPYGPKPILP